MGDNTVLHCLGTVAWLHFRHVSCVVTFPRVFSVPFLHLICITNQKTNHGKFEKLLLAFIPRISHQSIRFSRLLSIRHHSQDNGEFFEINQRFDLRSESNRSSL